MKQKVGALCLAAALLVLSGCGGSSLSIESRQWELSAVLDGETGAVWPAGPPGKKRTRTRLWSLSTARPKGDASPYRGRSKPTPAPTSRQSAPKRTRCTKSL